MKKVVPVLLFLAFSLSAFTAHKFYVAIFQINFVPERSMIQITSRIFVDDLNEALKLKHKRTFTLENQDMSPQDLEILQKYLSEKFIVKVNGKPQTLKLLSCEMEANVLISYISINNIKNIRSLDIQNQILTEYVTEQQNIIQTNVNGKKKNLLLTADNPSGNLNF